MSRGQGSTRPTARSFPQEESRGWHEDDPVVLGSVVASALAFVGLTLAVIEADGATQLDLWILDVITRELLVPIQGFDWLNAAASPHLLEAGFVALFLYFGAKSQWRKAYLSLALGPGGSAIVYLAQVGIRRIPPGGAPGRMVFSNYPSAVATLAPLLVLTALVLFGRRLGSRRFLGGILLGLLYPVLVTIPDLFTRVWPTDLLAGSALGVTWFGVCLSGYVVFTGEDLPSFGDPRTISRRRHLGPTIDRWLKRARAYLLRLWETASRYLYRYETLYLLIAAGVLVRISTYWTYQIGFDANIYVVMAESIAEQGNLEMPWGATYSLDGIPAPSHHYPPLYPAYLAGFYKIFGVSEATTQLASIVSSLALLGVVYACTRDLYDHQRALITTTVVSLFPVLIKNTGEAYSENLVLITFVLTLWSIFRSLDDAKYIVPAGLFAGLGYLAKSSMGYFFFIAGAAGFLWRLYWMGRDLFRDRFYWTAVAVFGIVVGGWAGRNWLVHGTWQTSEHLRAAYAYAFAHLDVYISHLPIVFLFLLGFGYLVQMGGLPWFPWLKEIPLLDSEHDSGLWLAMGLPLLLTTFVYSALWTLEDFFYTGAVRYLVPALVPMTWLLLRHVDLSSETVKVAGAVSLLFLAGGSAVYAAPYQPLYDDAPEDLGRLHEDGEKIAFAGLDGHGTYRFYLDVTDNGTKEVDVKPLTLQQADATEAHWLVTKGRNVEVPSGYDLVDRYRTEEKRLEPISLWEKVESNATAQS